MKMELKNTHEAKMLVIEQEESYSQLEEKLIESLDNRYILKPVGTGRETGTFEYDISELEPLTGYLVNRKLSRTEMVGFLAQLKSVIMTLEDHMLSDANLLLDPEGIFIDRFNRKVRFTPVCQLEGSFGERLRPLTEAMFLHADLEQPESLRFAVELLKTSMGKDVRLHDLMQLIRPGNLPVAEYPENVPALYHKEVPEILCDPYPANGPVLREPVEKYGFEEDEETVCIVPGEQQKSPQGVQNRKGMDMEPDGENKKNQHGVKNFIGGLIAGIKENFSEEE